MFVQKRTDFDAVDNNNDHHTGISSSSSRCGPMIKIVVSYGSSHLELYLPAQSSFCKYTYIYI